MSTAQRDNGMRLPILVVAGSLLVLILVFFAGRLFYGGWLERQVRESELTLREQWEVLVQWKLTTEAELERATQQMEFFSDQIGQLQERERALREVLSVAQERGVASGLDPSGASETIVDLQRQIDDVVNEFGRLQQQLETASQERQVLVATLDRAERELTQVAAGTEPDPAALEQAEEQTRPVPLGAVEAPAGAPVAPSLEDLAQQETLARVQEQTRREQFEIANLQDRYRSAIVSILRGDLMAAERDLQGIRQTLADPEVGSLLAIVNRRSLDAALVGLIDQAIADRRSRDALLATLTDADADIARIRTLVQDGDLLLGTGDVRGAITTYRSALDIVPAVADAAERIAEAEEELRVVAAAPLIEASIGAGSSGDVEAIAQILSTLGGLYPSGDAATLRSIADSVVDASAAIERSFREVAATQDSTVGQVQAELAASQAEVEALQEDLDLLDADLASLAAALSNAARTRPASSDASALLTSLDIESQAILLSTIDSFQAGIASTEAERGTEVGVEQTLDRLRTGIGYLDGSLDIDDATVLNRIESDARIKRTMLEIQELGLVGLVRDELPLGQLRFIGVVGAVIGDRILVDQLTATEVQPGDQVVVARRTDVSEVEIAVAIAISVERDRIRIQVDELEPGYVVQAQDIAYLLVD